VIDGLEEAGYTRRSSGPEYLADRDAEAAVHGWAVIT
jgi:hypothetical protein